VYGVDSAELATGAAILGIVHAPGYPLYLLTAHFFTLLPIGDVGFRVNLFSAVSLALTVPFLYSLLYRLVGERWIAVSAALTFVWSYYVWGSGTLAEIYAPQLLTLAMLGWSLVRMYQDYLAKGYTTARDALLIGALFGIAVAMAPPSILVAPGLVLAFLLMRVPWRISSWASCLSALIVVSTLLYFPLRGAAYPEFNKIGFYDAQGIFHNFDFHTVDGVLKAVSGEQFRHLFFAHGYVPNFNQLTVTFSWLWRNYLGIGVILGLIGSVYLLRRRPGLLTVWLGLTLPYTYFYLCYGAIDRETMFGPTYLAWTVLLAFGLQRLFRFLIHPLRLCLLVGLPLIAFISNFSAVDLSDDTSVRTHAEAVLQSLPPNAVVVGYWADVTPLQYLQFVEQKRPDVKIYDLFLFRPSAFQAFVDTLSSIGQTPLVLINSAIMSLPDTSPSTITIVPILTSSTADEETPPANNSYESGGRLSFVMWYNVEGVKGCPTKRPLPSSCDVSLSNPLTIDDVS
jgi:hypothetical protein